MRSLFSEPDWEADRDRMIARHLRPRGISDPGVLRAMALVPRELFVPPSSRHRAYTDHALPLSHGQTISQPYMVAMMTQALELQGGERVLEVGTGSGYQAAVLSELCSRVWTVERVPELAQTASRLLRDLGYDNVEVRVGDGSRGWPEEAPFDAILVSAAAPHPPPSLLDQLEFHGGRLVVPVGEQDLQRVLRLTRSGSEYTTERMTACRFVPLLGAEGWEE
jgi:protein-L-isoaspartate(D-aspartate) O-methyltransferase